MNEKFFDLKSEKQDRMINASLHLFAVNGYKHASTDDIIKEAGISKGLLFHYFTSKQGLYDFLLDYSVRYLLFEYDRTVGDEHDYFAFHEKLETAKSGILRNYPYMYGFINRALTESSADCSEMGLAALKKYSDTMAFYTGRLDQPALKEGVTLTQVENLIAFTVQGLTDIQLKENTPDADKLFSQVTDYVRLIAKLSLAN